MKLLPPINFTKTPRKSDKGDSKIPSHKRVPAVKRAAEILWLMAERSSPMTLSQISHSVDSLPSTCLHTLRELVTARLVSVNRSTKSYSLGEGIRELAQSAAQQDNFAEIARVHLQRLSTQMDVTTTVTAQTDEKHITLIAFASPSKSVSLNVTLGARVPTFSGAAGRCIAAHSGLSKAELKTGFFAVKWENPPEFKNWLDEVEQTRIQGYGEDHGNFNVGVTALSAPIFSPDGTVSRVIGCFAISAQLDQSHERKISQVLMQTASDISTQLGS